MKTLCTFPGRHGDLLWALPTIRAISEHVGHPVDLQIAGEFKGLLTLLRLQPYLGVVTADEGWSAQDRTPPTIAAGPRDQVYHLGYLRWPELPLPFETFNTAVAAGLVSLPPLDLTQPWILSPVGPRREVVYGFTDCWFELKYGLTELLFPDVGDGDDPNTRGIFPPGSRWITEAHYLATTWLEAAAWIAGAKVFLTDCSALHVLAVALGIPVIIVEPMEARWNTIFYPCEKPGQVTVVAGLDGKPTFDARHVRETLDYALAVTL